MSDRTHRSRSRSRNRSHGRRRHSRSASDHSVLAVPGVPALCTLAARAVPAGLRDTPLLPAEVRVRLRETSPHGLLKLRHEVIAHRDEVNQVTGYQRRDGELRLVTASDDHSVKQWSVPALELKSTAKPVSRLALAVATYTLRDGRRCMVVSSADAVRVLNAETGEPVCPQLSGHTEWCRGVSSFTDDQGDVILVTASSDGTARTWHGATGHAWGPPLHHVPAEQRPRRLPVFAAHAYRMPDASLRVATLSVTGRAELSLWDPTSGQRLAGPQHHGVSHSISMCAFPDSRRRPRLAYGGPKGQVVLASGRTGAALLRYMPHSQLSTVTSLVTLWSAGGHTALLAADATGHVQAWSADTGEPIGAPRPQKLAKVRIRSMCVVETYVAVASDDGRVALWDMPR